LEAAEVANALVVVRFIEVDIAARSEQLEGEEEGGVEAIAMASGK
jgi:hypothetical protein